MLNKTNFIAAAIIAAAAFSAAPAANASVAGGIAASSIATTTAATTAVPAAAGNIVLAHGRRGHRHGWGFYGGHRWGGYGYGGGCRWLKRKWHRTGRRYWKRRYFRCINDY